MTEDIRWKQRLANLSRSVALLREAIDLGVETLSDLEKHGVTRRFEVALELAWKTMGDYLQHEGIALEPITPRNVVKEAFAAKILSDGLVWIDMLNHRNLLSHTYSAAVFESAVVTIRDRYLAPLEALVSWFEAKS